MKVITQLVQHFWQRGVLAASEVDYLVCHGFVRARDLPGYVPPPQEPEPLDESPTWAPPADPLPATALESVEDALVRRKVHRGRRGEPKGAVLEIEDLCERLRDEFARREPHLPALVRLGRKVSMCNDWQEALAALRQVDGAGFQELLTPLLRSGVITLHDLWPALDIEPLHRLLADDEVRGRAARAYLALLVSRDVANLGKYMWILQSDEMQVANNLRVAHIHLRAALADYFVSDRRLLTRCLARGAGPVVFRAMILLYNAARTDEKTASSEYLLADYAKGDIWKQAWTAALGMDQAAVTRLLVKCYAEPTARDRLRESDCQHQLYCPKEWRIPRIEPACAISNETPIAP